MDLLKFASDPDKELVGVPVRMDATTTLLIARFNNPEFRKTQTKLTDALARATGAVVDTEEAEDILNQVMAKHILLGWTDLYIEGEKIKYSEDKALEIFRDDRLSTFKEIVLAHSQSQQHFQLKTLKEDLGNSVRLSSTRPVGQVSNNASSKI